MTDEKWDTRDMGNPTVVTADETLRAIVGQLWENDNDEGELEVTLRGTDGTESIVVFGINIKSIDGVPGDD